MSGYPPPPYGPPGAGSGAGSGAGPGAGPGAPYGYDAKTQRRILKAQIRAQRDQMRVQKRAMAMQAAAYRERTRGLQRGSILGPVLVLGLGVLLLLGTLGTLHLAGFWAWYGRWWPMVLIVAGLVLVGEWAFDRGTAAGVPYVRRGLGGGTVVLLILLACVGSSIHAFGVQPRFWTPGLHFDGNNWAEFLGDKHDEQVTLNEPLAKGTIVAVDDARGDVTITGTSPDDAVHVVADEQIYADSDESVQDKSRQLQPVVERSEGRWSLRVPAVDGASTDLTITVPAWAAATVTAAHGDVDVSGVQGATTIATEHGDTQVEHVAGPVTVHTDSRGSSVSVDDAKGMVTLKGTAGDLDLTDAGAGVTIDGDFYGDTHLEHVAGPLSFRTSRTTFTLARLEGEADISQGAALSGSGLVGPVEVRTYSRNIELEGVTGGVTVVNKQGSVTVGSTDPVGPVSIENENGEVELTLPQGAGVTLDAQTQGGSIEDALALQPVTNGDSTTVRGQVGNGAAKVEVRTSHADISIQNGPEVKAHDGAGAKKTGDVKSVTF